MRAVTLLLCLDELIWYSDRSVWSFVLDIVMLHLAVGGSFPLRIIPPEQHRVHETLRKPQKRLLFLLLLNSYYVEAYKHVYRTCPRL